MHWIGSYPNSSLFSFSAFQISMKSMVHCGEMNFSFYPLCLRYLSAIQFIWDVVSLSLTCGPIKHSLCSRSLSLFIYKPLEYYSHSHMMKKTMEKNFIFYIQFLSLFLRRICILLFFFSLKNKPRVGIFVFRLFFFVFQFFQLLLFDSFVVLISIQKESLFFCKYWNIY